jgi:hypothetical protein
MASLAPSGSQTRPPRSNLGPLRGVQMYLSRANRPTNTPDSAVVRQGQLLASGRGCTQPEFLNSKAGEILSTSPNELQTFLNITYIAHAVAAGNARPHTALTYQPGKCLCTRTRTGWMADDRDRGAVQSTKHLWLWPVAGSDTAGNHGRFNTQARPRDTRHANRQLPSALCPLWFVFEQKVFVLVLCALCFVVFQVRRGSFLKFVPMDPFGTIPSP